MSTDGARYEDVAVGAVHAHDYVISERVYEAFLAAFDDRSPIHVDDARAVAAGFERRVMHGAILNGFLSHFVGMVFPGASALLLSADLRFIAPSYLGDALRLTATVAQKLDVHRTLLLHVALENLTRGGVAANGRVQVRVACRSIAAPSTREVHP